MLVGLGGFVGSSMRFGVSRYLQNRAGVSGYLFPWGTLTVNLSGAFILSFLMTAWIAKSPHAETWRLLVAVGILGGYTTFSALVFDFWQLSNTGLWARGIGYVALSVFGGLFLAYMGLRLGRLNG